MASIGRALSWPGDLIGLIARLGENKADRQFCRRRPDLLGVHWGRLARGIVWLIWSRHDCDTIFAQRPKPPSGACRQLAFIHVMFLDRGGMSFFLCRLPLAWRCCPPIPAPLGEFFARSA